MIAAQPCPSCGNPLWRWYEPSFDDPDDAEPHAECPNPDCSYGY